MEAVNEMLETGAERSGKARRPGEGRSGLPAAVNPVSSRVIDQVLLGVSTRVRGRSRFGVAKARGYQRSLPALPERIRSRGCSKSGGGRHVVARTRQSVEEFLCGGWRIWILPFSFWTGSMWPSTGWWSRWGLPWLGASGGWGTGRARPRAPGSAASSCRIFFPAGFASRGLYGFV
jgi:hypothetical protein